MWKLFIALFPMIFFASAAQTQNQTIDSVKPDIPILNELKVESQDLVKSTEELKHEVQKQPEVKTVTKIRRVSRRIFTPSPAPEIACRINGEVVPIETERYHNYFIVDIDSICSSMQVPMVECPPCATIISKRKPFWQSVISIFKRKK